MLIKYFILVSISVFVFELSTIQTLQENEKAQYQNSLKEFEALMNAKKHDNEDESKPLAQNLTESMIKSKIKLPLEKKRLRTARNILIQLRDFIYSTENNCIRNTSKIKNSNATQSTFDNLPLSTIFPTINPLASPTTKPNEGKHCIRWKTFFEECNHRDFLSIKAKVKSPQDRRVFAEQTEVLIKCTGKFRPAHLDEQWYKESNYSKEILIDSLKKHTTFDDHFLTFVDVLYDIVVDFYEYWRIKLESKLMTS